MEGNTMEVKVRLGEVIPPEMMEANREHIIDFLQQEGINTDPDNLEETEIRERQIKELLAELASNLDH
jgi:hypothetical protein